MGSMYMSEELLSKDLLSTHYKKFWTVGGGKEEKESRRHVSYRKRYVSFFPFFFFSFSPLQCRPKRLTFRLLHFLRDEPSHCFFFC